MTKMIIGFAGLLCGAAAACFADPGAAMFQNSPERAGVPGYGFRSMPEAQPSFEKATDRVKAVGSRPVRCTIPLSRLQKPTPPNARWRLSENHLGSSSIARKRTHHCNARRFSNGRPPVRQPSRVLVSILTIRPRSRGHRTTTGDDTRVRSMNSSDMIRQNHKKLPRQHSP